MEFYREDLRRRSYAAYVVSNGKVVVPARYSNSCGFALAVVAVLSFRKSGLLIDWAAYWGGCDKTQREHDAYEWVRKHGNKMSGRDAAHFFEGIPLDLYRG